ncbi:MAG: diguanylate cyclase [Methylomarinum sp.]|nr:diguanylate cyclase [Methylomarinum sp.]
MGTITSQQGFDWVISLTKQKDYQGLTCKFLEMLAGMPGIKHVEAFEIHGGKQVRVNEKHQLTEQLVRRFPLDFTSESEGIHMDWLDGFDQITGLKVISSVGQEQLLFPIKDSIGPVRAISIHGKIQDDLFFVVESLLKIYRNQVVLHDSKERDVLTHLPNRQSLDSRLMQVCEYFQGHEASDKRSWVALLDIDHFKRVNDDFGHLYGDEVLLTFSQLMEKRFRYNDFLFRFGGEEFVVILNLATRDDAEKVFNSFREMVAAYEFPTVGKVTVSIGVTNVSSHEMPSELLDCADQALYYAKEHGRNQVSFYSEIAHERNIQSQSNEIELF